jgi:hypothetical protein
MRTHGSLDVPFERCRTESEPSNSSGHLMLSPDVPLPWRAKPTSFRQGSTNLPSRCGRADDLRKVAY